MKKFAIQIDTYEGKNIVISHVIYGKNEKEAMSIVRAHMGTDTFFKASMTTGVFKGMNLYNAIHQYIVDV